jgi:hypothetical protein
MLFILALFLDCCKTCLFFRDNCNFWKFVNSFRFELH